MIDEDKILAFIEKNDKRRGANLDKYKELIKRLLGHNISKKDIYEFIKKEDSEIGSQINFYKYISRNIETKSQKPKPTIEPKTKEVTTTQISPTIPKLQSTKASDVLSQDFDLLAFPEQ